MLYRYMLTLTLMTLGLATLTAQEEPRKLFDVIYADAKVGGFVILDYSATALAQVTASAGYRFTDRHGLGLGYHRESFNASSDMIYFHGLGVDYRLSTRSGFIFKAGGGFILRAVSDSESIVINEYTGGGYFLDISADYHFRSGITLGLYASANDRAGFDEINTTGSDDRSDWFLQREYFSSWSNVGIAVGFALPRRGRR